MNEGGVDERRARRGRTTGSLLRDGGHGLPSRTTGSLLRGRVRTRGLRAVCGDVGLGGAGVVLGRRAGVRGAACRGGRRGARLQGRRAGGVVGAQELCAAARGAEALPGGAAASWGPGGTAASWGPGYAAASWGPGGAGPWAARGAGPWALLWGSVVGGGGVRRRGVVRTVSNEPEKAGDDDVGPLFSSASVRPTKIVVGQRRIFVGLASAHENTAYFRRPSGRRKYVPYFRGPADENINGPTKIRIIFVGH